MNLDDDEVDIVQIALQHFVWRAKAQLDDRSLTNGYRDAAWFSTRYCKAKAEALIARIEQHQEDQAEEKADGA